MSEPSAEAWRCSVCGYVHREAEPPDWCPICGAAREDFEPHAEAPPAPAGEVRQWRCLNCTCVHGGSEPPKNCPVCGAPSDRFEPVVEAAAPGGSDRPPSQVVVVGAGIAGLSAVESLRQAAPGTRIVLISAEAELPYYRLNLTRRLAGEIGPDDLPVHAPDWYAQNRVELLRGAEVAELRLGEQAVELRGGRRVDFERLILAVGAHPFVPPLAGTHRRGVTTLRTSRDASHILDAAREGMTCVCIGGGILGMETAGALARRGLDVTLLEGHEWLMPRQLSRTAGDRLRRQVEEIGIRVRTQARTEEVVGDERAAGVRLEDGETLPAEMVVIATGVRPNSHLARRAGLEVDRGVVVDHYLFTSHPNVLAAGDVAEHRGVLYGTWSAAQYQGGIAGMNAAGMKTEFGGIPRSNTLKVLGVDLLSIGQFEPEDASFLVVEEDADGGYFRFVFRDGRMVGAVLLGDASISGSVKRAVEGQADLSGLLARRPTAQQVARELASS